MPSYLLLKVISVFLEFLQYSMIKFFCELRKGNRCPPLKGKGNLTLSQDHGDDHTYSFYANVVVTSHVQTKLVRTGHCVAIAYATM